MYYVVDGSSKGSVDGAGVVFVDNKGKARELSFTRVNSNSNSLQAESFALECVFNLLLESKKTAKDITIYTDNQALYRYINLGYEAKDDYVKTVVKQAILLKKYADFKFELVDETVQSLAKQAHNLSREYMKDQFWNSLSLGVLKNTAFQLV